MYEYRVKILKIVDGDTVDVDIDLGFGVWLRDERVRLYGIDTPESRTSDKVEKVFGLAAKHRLQELLGETSVLRTLIDKDGEDAKGKFGRILGDFVIGDTTVTSVLIKEHHAVAYHGQSKNAIREKHIQNRQILINEGIVKLGEELE